MTAVTAADRPTHGSAYGARSVFADRYVNSAALSGETGQTVGSNPNTFCGAPRREGRASGWSGVLAKSGHIGRLDSAGLSGRR